MIFQKSVSWVRDEIERIVKEKDIDRSGFCEFSKLKYEEILKKFYFTFCDRKNFTPSVISFDRRELHFRDDLKSCGIAGVLQSKDWLEYLDTVKGEIREDGKLFLIMFGWVYEGYADDIFAVLSEAEEWANCFYVVSPKFEWFIVHDYIEECAVVYKK